MLTPQEITDKVFIKAVFGGYDMTGVDEFLESVCTDYTALYKENAILKSKLKVLVEKVEEYRSTEDSMRMALLTAQRMGEEITTDANKQREEMMKNADLEIKAKLVETARRIADEELRLSIAAKETSKFIELSQAIMRKHSEFLTKLETARRAVRPDVPADADSAPAAVQPQSREEQISDTAEAIGNAMDRITGGVPVGDANSSAGAYDGGDAEPQYIGDYDDESDDNTKVYSINGDEDSVTPRPKFDFDDLKFGSNFHTDE